MSIIIGKGLWVPRCEGYKTKQGSHLSEDKDEDHADKKTRLLGSSSHTRITNNANGEPSSKTGQTHSQTSTKMDKPTVKQKVS